MDRGGAGISWKYTTSGNDYKQPDVHASASGSGRYRHGTVRHGHALPYIPRRNEFYNTSDVCSSHCPPRHSVKPVHELNTLIIREKMDWLVRLSARYGDYYDGKKHSQFATSIKQYTSASKRPLNHSEQRQLIPLLHDFKTTPGWAWRGLTTTLHSLTSAGVFTPHKFMDEGVKETQVSLLSNLLDTVIRKCKQKNTASDSDSDIDIDAQGISNLLWTMAKLVDNGLELLKTAKLKEAVAALLPHVKTIAESKEKKDHFNTQGTANLLWALAKLVDNWLELAKTPKLKEAVVAMLPHVKTKAESKEEKDQFKPQEVSNLVWAVAKQVDNGLELGKTPIFKEVLAALLPHVKSKAESKEKKNHFIPQHIANLLWAVAKLVDNGLELEKTPRLREVVAALLPLVKTKAESKEQKDHFIPQHIANLSWAVAKLVENGLELETTPKLQEAVAALFSHVKSKANSKEKDHFIPQHIANLLWAVAKLVDSGLELEKTPKLKEALTAVLSHVKTKAESKEEKDHFNAQHIANLLWAMAKLVENGLELEKTAKLKGAVTSLLLHVKNRAESKQEKDRLNTQTIVILLWALVKLVDNGLELEKTPKLKEAVAALLPHVTTQAESKEQKDRFKPQDVSNLLWVLATLMDNGLELEITPKLKEAVVVLLPHVKTKAESKEEKDRFTPQHIANLLWSVAKLGEAIELSMVKSTFDSLVDRISEIPQFSQQGILMSLWGVMVFCARFYLYDGNKSSLEKHIGDLLSRLENTFPIDTEDESIVGMATSWLGRACPVVPHYPTIISQFQSTFRDQLQSSLPSLKIEEEKSLKSLPPVDLLLPDYNMVIDIQGPSHYVSGDFKTRNGSTLLKIALLQKLGFEVIEIPVNKLVNQNSIKTVIEQVKTKLAVPPEARGSVSFNRDEESADEAYFTAEEYLEEQTDKPKRKKKRRKAGKTYLHKH